MPPFCLTKRKFNMVRFNLYFVFLSRTSRELHMPIFPRRTELKPLVFVFLLFFSVQAAPPMVEPAAELLNYAELVELYELDNPSGQLQIKLQKLLTTPFLSNEATGKGTRPLKPYSQRLGRHIRIAYWNIERGLEYEALELAFTNPSTLISLLDKKLSPGEITQVQEQAALLSQADIIVLNEVDWGMKRTGYRNVAADLASALQMNYAYGVEFIEVDPIALGTEKFELIEEKDRETLAEQITVDANRYKGLHGTAILSRFPLVNIRLIPFTEQGHDWYATEKKGVSKVEKSKRKVSEIVFQQKIEREVRRGGRTMLLADIEDSGLSHRASHCRRHSSRSKDQTCEQAEATQGVASYNQRHQESRCGRR